MILAGNRWATMSWLMYTNKSPEPPPAIRLGTLPFYAFDATQRGQLHTQLGAGGHERRSPGRPSHHPRCSCLSSSSPGCLATYLGKAHGSAKRKQRSICGDEVVHGAWRALSLLVLQLA